MPVILCKTCTEFLGLKKGFQGGNLGNSLDTEQQRQRTNLLHAQLKSDTVEI